MWAWTSSAALRYRQRVWRGRVRCDGPGRDGPARQLLPGDTQGHTGVADRVHDVLRGVGSADADTTTLALRRHRGIWRTAYLHDRARLSQFVPARRRQAREASAALAVRQTLDHHDLGPDLLHPRSSWGPVGTCWGHAGDQKQASGAKSGGGEDVFGRGCRCFRRSRIPHRSGGHGVAGSNPASPTAAMAARSGVCAGEGGFAVRGWRRLRCRW
jgi:hypothetical protein